MTQAALQGGLYSHAEGMGTLDFTCVTFLEQGRAQQINRILNLKGMYNSPATPKLAGVGKPQWGADGMNLKISLGSG